MRCVPAGRRVPSGCLSRAVYVRVEMDGPIPELVLVTARQSAADFAAGFCETTEPPRVALQYVPLLLEQIRAEVEHALIESATARQD